MDHWEVLVVIGHLSLLAHIWKTLKSLEVHYQIMS